MSRPLRICAVSFVLILALLIAACGKVELYRNLTEEDANEMLVLLSENNIKATKKEEIRQNQVSYSIVVNEQDMVKARSLLVGHNLPRRQELGLSGVYKEKGLIPTPDEQKARYLLALKGEIINSLRRIPNVLDADVVLNVPVKDEFANADAQHELRPTASVVVRAKPDPTGLTTMTEAKIQQFVSNAIEGMNPRDVTVVISYLPVDEKTVRPGDVQTLPSLPQKTPEAAQQMAASQFPPVQYELIGLKLDAESKDRLKVYMLIFFLILMVMSVALIVVIIQGSRMRRTLEALKGHAGEHPAIEGQVMDEGPPQIGQGPPEEF